MASTGIMHTCRSQTRKQAKDPYILNNKTQWVEGLLAKQRKDLSAAPQTPGEKPDMEACDPRTGGGGGRATGGPPGSLASSSSQAA